MPEIEQSVRRRLQESLGELENTYQVNEFEFLVEDTSEPGVRRVLETACSKFTWDHLSQGLLLAWKAYSDRKREIVWFLSNAEENTTVEEIRPVTWEIEDIAKEFSRSRGLVPELVMCLEKAEESFSNLESLIAEYDCFHSEDYEEEGHIVIRVTVSSSQDTAFEDYDTFNDWMFENIADDSLECFVVTVRRRG